MLVTFIRKWGLIALLLATTACKGDDAAKASADGLSLVIKAVEMAPDDQAHEILQNGFIQIMEKEKLGHSDCVKGARVQLDAAPDQVHRLSHKAFSECALFPCSFKVDGSAQFCAKESKPDWLKPLLPARAVQSPDFATTWMILTWIKDSLPDNAPLWQRLKAQLPKLNRAILSEQEKWNGS
jgi:hypothetical protein